MKVISDDYVVDYKSMVRNSDSRSVVRFKYPPPPSWSRYKGTNLGVVNSINVDRRGRTCYDENKFAYDKPRNVFVDIDRSRPDRSQSVKMTYKSTSAVVNPKIVPPDHIIPPKPLAKMTKRESDMEAHRAYHSLMRHKYNSERMEGFSRDDRYNGRRRNGGATALRNGLFQLAVSRLFR